MDFTRALNGIHDLARRDGTAAVVEYLHDHFPHYS